ncbi:FAD-dependent monooxygenase [Streptomyces sp. HF10]|uniref:FAD-dependent monooxygenase n=1 Tax=Streptomyces sp. HF10 TaxID=2692233 RepID=UPI001316E2B6|nr:FAD-dependent monooxygenase [Streptomyces sp. HF10]QHC29227.1 FAD-dependent oxidoreductase [Streptomyces sp. HF10]
MTTTQGTQYDVVVAGAGPVGLFLAGELKLGGAARVLVVERLTEVDETIKAGWINHPSVVALNRRGLLSELSAVREAVQERLRAFRDLKDGDGDGDGDGGDDNGGTTRRPGFAGHFAGITLDPELFDGSGPEWADADPAAGPGLVIPQAELERALGHWAERLGVEVRRGVELTGFTEDADGVVVQLDGQTVRADWLVGCDGGRSTVRRLAGFEFPGTAPEITGYQALVELSGAERLKTGWNTTDVGTYVHGPFPGRVLTVEFDSPPADRYAPVTAGELEASLRRVSGVPEVSVTGVRTATRFTDNARQATEYRRGRVLLAGDAAHVHSPFGGQGLNLGLGDALNLGWKLAAVVRGRAPESLLDTYTAERHPIGAWVLDWTRAQIALMRPDRHARALRRVVEDLAGSGAGTTYLVNRVSGVWQRYDLPGSHPLTGANAPDLPLSDGTRLGEHLHTGRPLLLDLADSPALRALAAPYGGTLTVLTTTCPARPALRALLVRPDGFVAWAADTEDDERGGELTAALERWVGAPKAAVKALTRE